MSSAPGREEIARDASWLVQALDARSREVRLVQMDGETYRAASFLDDRIFQQRQVTAHILPWQSAASAVTPNSRRDARWIFHIGHVGSTLISRLLGEVPGVLSVREPRFLRDITELPASELAQFAEAAQALFSRTFAPAETALVKTTSFVSEIASQLAAGRPTIFIYATPEAYIPSILAGENSVLEMRGQAQSRAVRLSRRVKGMERHDQSDAHLAAAAWGCEITALEAAAETMTGTPIIWLDFDCALGGMADSLERLCHFLRFDASREQIEALATSPLMSRYSKALEYEYSADLRRELIAEARRDHRQNIDDALVMLDRAAQESPLLARALARSSSEA